MKEVTEELSRCSDNIHIYNIKHLEERFDSTTDEQPLKIACAKQLNACIALSRLTEDPLEQRVLVKYIYLTKNSLYVMK